MSVIDKSVDVLDEDEQEEAARVAYARAVGARLRTMRKQMRLSLQAVEAMSEQEFKASVLGAYERGERAISVPRLQRLAKLYDVPVDQLLPPDDATMTRWGATGTTEEIVTTSARRANLTGLGDREGGHRPDQAAHGERSRAGPPAPVPEHDPGAPSGLQRSDDHHPGRGRAGHRLPVRGDAGLHGHPAGRARAPRQRLMAGGDRP